MASNVTTTQRAHALRLGRLKAAESGRARAESRRSRVESVLDQLEQAGELVANIEIARRAGVGKNYLRESAPDLAARARQVRSRLAGERAEQALAQQDELREQIISENDQLLGELQRRGERIHFLENELAEARAQSLADRHGRIDGPTSAALRDQNGQLSDRVRELEAANRRLTMERDTLRHELADKLRELREAQRRIDASAAALQQSERAMRRHLTADD